MKIKELTKKIAKKISSKKSSTFFEEKNCFYNLLSIF